MLPCRVVSGVRSRSRPHPEQRDQAGRLLDLLLDGLRYRNEGLTPRSP
jgi:hypothetical protein